MTALAPLPDVSRLAAFPAARWRALARALQAAGLTLAYAAPILGALQPIAPPLRAPLKKWMLRRRREPAAYAMRMLLAGDPVEEAEARDVLGQLTDELLDAGFLERAEGGVVSPFVLAIVDDLYVVADDLARGGDAVMGLGETTAALCRAALSARAVESALDLGCGSGTCALVLSRCARRVVATDINPRALEIARVNAALNGVTNVELRHGSLFEPVAGEAFDLVVSQPPFVPRPEGAGASTFLYGGSRGDEIALELLSTLAPHLAPGGRAVLVVEWPEGTRERGVPTHVEGTRERGVPTHVETVDQPIAQRVRSAVGPDALDVLVLAAPPAGPDEHATAYAAAMFPALGDAFEREVLTRREHLERLGVRALRPTFTVLQRAGGRPPWTATMEVGPLAAIEVTSARLDKLLAARSLVGDRERLLAATLRVPEGTVFAEEQRGPGAGVESALSARFPPEALLQPMPLSSDLLFFVTFVHEAPTVRAGFERLAEEYEVDVEQAIQRMMPVLERALSTGLLEIAAEAP